MKYSRWPLVLAALAFCMLLASPMNADAASQSAPSDQKLSTASSHAAKKSSGDTETRKSKREKSSDKTASSHSSRSKRDKAESRSKSNKNKSSSTASAADKERQETADNRDLWLKRAQDNDIITGKASWYGRDFHGGSTASGLDYDMYTFTAAHRTLPMGTVVRVTDQQNGKSVMVCVTDRGPFIRGRIIDLSFAAAQQIDIKNKGITRVNLEVVSDESGTPLKPGEAFFVRYNAAQGDEKVGPFRAFADAAAMHEALRQVHPEAEVVMDQSK